MPLMPILPGKKSNRSRMHGNRPWIPWPALNLNCVHLLLQPTMSIQLSLAAAQPIT